MKEPDTFSLYHLDASILQELMLHSYFREPSLSYARGQAYRQPRSETNSESKNYGSCDVSQLQAAP